MAVTAYAKKIEAVFLGGTAVDGFPDVIPLASGITLDPKKSQIAEKD
jgi:hypothetical protein